MAKVFAAITTSVVGYIAGPVDRPGQGLGEGGERLHYWVMGGPWTFATDREPGEGMTAADREYYDALVEDAADAVEHPRRLVRLDGEVPDGMLVVRVAEAGRPQPRVEYIVRCRAC